MFNSVGLLPIAVGALALLFNDRLSRFIVKSQNRAWGHRHGEGTRKMVRCMCIIFGVAVMVQGVLSLFGLIHFG